MLLAACAFEDSQNAELAQSRLIGLSEAELESCVGAPDQKGSFGKTDILTYYATSTSNIHWSIPFIGGAGFSNGGYCHATFDVVNDRVVRLLYSGEQNQVGADAYCAPIIRTCLAHVDEIRSERATAAPEVGQAAR